MEQELQKFRGDTHDTYNNLSLIRETESRVDNIEYSISRFEDSKVIFPQIEYKIENLKKNQKEKFDIIKHGAQLLNDNLTKILNLFSKSENASFGDPFASTN